MNWKGQGFTLVELSVVLVIVGLLVAGIMAGQSLIKAAELRSVITQVNGFKVAINAFRDKYDFLPGDIRNATDYWPASFNGDGDGKTLWGDEADVTWQQLALAGTIPGSYSSGANVIGVHVPASKIKGGGYLLYNTDGWQQFTEAISFGSELGVVNGSILTPADAASIDQKIDDGLGDIGEVRGARGQDVNPGDCSAAGDYNLSNEAVACRPYFFLQLSSNVLAPYE